MEEETTVKEGKVTKLCCFMYVIVLIVTVIIVILLGLILYEVQNQHSISTNDCCEKSVESQLAEDQAKFLMQVRDLCTALCSERLQTTESIYENPELLFLGDTSIQIFRCLACCHVLDRAECNSLDLEDGFPNPYCAWVNSVNGSGCVSVDPNIAND